MSKLAIVTGACGGIGQAIATALHGNGFGLILTDIVDGTCLSPLMDRLRSNEPSVEFVQADIGDEAQHEKLFSAASRFGTELTTLVNNAGVSSTVRGDPLHLPVDSFDRAVRVNLRAPFLLSQRFASLLLTGQQDETAFRSIINITSVNAAILGINRPDYCITKAGMSMMSSLFAGRLAVDGIHVYEVRPGITSTDMTLPSKDKYDALIDEGLVPMKRWGQPDDIGQAVANLAKGDFAFSTGDVINVDGGLHMYRV